ncbi:hypothetical protein OCAR_6152 [Afipia carboxidovorans OM5]|uniref:Uncharacterized protein n=1 Tax=Afipia carboxidovorans (strain ATCC 49405 / DSM 1227 / KCTC 32145 / OM5) TaxID=504832 RepID=B6JEJ9_AFIC5|nr:hypothetical protein [Afipia carboxidovorans]ACI93266.1 hypothetical protein OCAR_6152 [Afipia carboxidovorans OM5]AEI03012.1 hypothetical protein OCA4_c18750 [Afipia carboxidovorans OM4]AEI06589.1 hypothetical protein OCA5_c18760 [Afipia carboxidovorans OM5]
MSETNTETKTPFVREKIRQVVVEHEIVKLNELLKLQQTLLSDGRIEGMGERNAQSEILQESILHRANELLVLVQDSDIVKH